MEEKKPVKRRGYNRGSNMDRIMALKVGQSTIIVGSPGQKAHVLERSINSGFRADSIHTGSFTEYGFTMAGGIGIFEGELSRPLVMVTRISQGTALRGEFDAP